ncbi:hypothetical protein Tsp_04083 [Trichinella spiralis]|uniref:hypothetical protein n=1 Tax=Trichinella spiralis TaxID=6334 RepID=UPI0001EFB351|nr:hypothetical protein Tsp_04083 [Trichinella spiralis]
MEKRRNLNLARCLIGSKKCTLVLIPLLSNYVLHDDRDLFCVAPPGNILAFFLVKLYMIALRYTTPTAAVDKAETTEFSMNNTCYCVALLFIGHIWCFTSRNTL